MIERVVDDRAGRRPEIGDAGAQVEQVIRGVPGDERRVGVGAAARRRERVEVGRRRAAEPPVRLVVDGARERSVEPLLRLGPERVEPLARALGVIGGAAGDEELPRSKRATASLPAAGSAALLRR